MAIHDDEVAPYEDVGVDEELLGYWEDGRFVIRDPNNPEAWICSDVTLPISDVERGRTSVGD